MEDKDLRAYVAELLGTFVVVFLTGLTIPANVRGELQPWMVVVVALAAGLSYAAALAFTLPYSSGFLNPALTISLWVFRQLDGMPLQEIVIEMPPNRPEWFAVRDRITRASNQFF